MKKEDVKVETPIEFDPKKFTGETALADPIVEPVAEPKEDEGDLGDSITLDDEGEPDLTDHNVPEEVEEPEDHIDDGAPDESGLTPEAYRVLATELGIDVTTKDELIKKVKESLTAKNDLEKELEVVRASFSVGERVARWDSMLKLENDALVKEELKARGLSDAEIDSSFEELEKSGQVDAMATNVRIDIRSAKNEYIKTASTRDAQEKAAQKEATDKYVSSVKTALDNMDKLFGTKIGKTKEDAERIRGKAFEKYTTGQFFKNLVSQPDKLAKLILWDTLEGSIEKHLEAKGANKERKRIMLDQLGNAVKQSYNGIVEPEVKVDGFDPAAFIKGL